MATSSLLIVLTQDFNLRPIISHEEATIHPERYIELRYGSLTLPSWVEESLVALNWEVFATRPTKGHAGLCSEFLFHLKRSKENRVRVQGREISISPEIIRNTLSLPSVQSCAYKEILEQQRNEDLEKEVIQTIAEPQTALYQGMIHWRHLNLQAKFWRAFINKKIIPNFWNSDVPWSQAVLLYCIIKQKKVDASSIIFEHFRAQLDQNQFFFPCLVSEICKNAGITALPRNDENFIGIPLGFRSWLAQLTDEEKQNLCTKEHQESCDRALVEAIAETTGKKEEGEEEEEKEAEKGGGIEKDGSRD